MSSSPRPNTAVTARQDLRLARLWWAAGWILLVSVTWSCLEPARYVPNLHVSDKFEHAAAYFLMALWFGGLLERRRYPLLALGLLVLGAIIEVAQGLMGWGRQMDFWDFVADAQGVVLAIALLYAGLGSWMSQLERLFGLSREPS
jgi:VanZ family protein